MGNPQPEPQDGWDTELYLVSASQPQQENMIPTGSELFEGVGNVASHLPIPGIAESGWIWPDLGTIENQQTI